MHKRGFTIFFAVLVASLALAVGLSIYDILVREIQLSGIATQSQYAIYAADTGAECALYWDNQYKTVSPSDADGSAFATSSDYTVGDTANGTTGVVTCNTQDIVQAGGFPAAAWSIVAPTYNQLGGPPLPQATTTFYLSLGTSQKDPCALVTVAKNASQKGYPSQTTVTAHGYNTCTSGSDRLERVLQVSY
jgi:hypothetical protein